MSNNDLERVATTSPDLVQERLEALRSLIPEAFGEDGLDIPKLRAAVGDFVDDAPERYQFTWSGKQAAIQAFQIPSRATLVPDRDSSVNWDETGHVFIEGENLEVLKLLYKSYFGRVKCIYIDPPYNTGNDFVYPDDYADPLEQYLRVTGQKDADGNLLTSNPETAGRYHSAWLSMMYPRLFLARQLLTDDGVIFISIDDNEVHNLRMLMNEVFGEENFVAEVVWKNVYGGGAKSKHAVQQHEYVLLYARTKNALGTLDLPPDPKAIKRYKERDAKYPTRGPFFTQPLATTSMDARPNLRFPISWQGEEIWPEKQWQWSRDRVEAALTNDDLVIRRENGKWSVRYKQYLRDEDGVERAAKLNSVQNGPWTQAGTAEIVASFGDGKTFPFPKPVGLVKHLAGVVWRDTDAIILDFFSGSGTTAQAILELNREDGGNRRFVMVQLPEPLGQPQTLDDGTVLGTIADIGRERIRRVIDRMNGEATGKLDVQSRETPEDLGFRSYRLEPSTYRAPAETEAEGVSALFTAPLVDGWTPGNLLHEIALKEGFDLSAKIEQVADVKTNTIYRITDPYKEQTCLVCLDDTLDAKTAKALGLTRDDLFICLDAALDDTLAANLALQCRLKII